MLNDMTTGSQPFTVQIRSRGQMTIPRKLRDALSLEDGDTLTLFQIGDAVVLASQPPRTYELADKIADLMESEGITLADLLADLPKIREDIYKERQAGS
ncbi:MAG: AbrB/MazE/SpoVT family DNA-binding domain-containing protein [Anaerolineae bacterium]|nr:AbrB/MazE/SpoVT family DNA-binding domain-containing protein [Anaerolineae bacterium]